MISYLTGQCMLEKDGIVILTGGVGYGVRISDTFKQQIHDHDSIETYIYTHVREDALELYGFRDRQEREVFLLLLGVSGVGPKTALAILSFSTRQIIDAVQNADISLFSSVPRVGKKLAQKIIIDLRTKLGALKELDLGPISPQRQEVMLALQGLGFAEHDIYQILQTIDVEKIGLSEAVKIALRTLGKQKSL